MRQLMDSNCSTCWSSGFVEEFTNYSVGATLSTEYVDFDLRFWGTDADTLGDVADERVVLTISRSL